MKTLTHILSFFIREPSKIFFASDLLEMVDCSMQSMYRLLNDLVVHDLILKHRTIYTLNPRVICDVGFCRDIVPYIGKQHKTIAYIYLIRYMLAKLTDMYSIAELRVIVRRPKRDIEYYLDLLEKENITQQKNDTIWQLHPDIVSRLAKANLVTLNKLQWRAYEKIQ